MLKIVEDVRAPFKQELDRVIGTSKETLVRYYVIENPMDNMLTDALMWKYQKDNIDIVLSNGFRFCPPLVKDEKTGIATITNDFLWSMFPVNSEVKRATVTGKQLWDWMEKELNNVFAHNPAQRFGGWVIRFKGMKVNFTMKNEMGKRVNSIVIKGKPIDISASYNILACERDGDPDDTLCRIEKVTNPKKTGHFMHDIVREYLSKNSPVSPRVEGRAIATDAPPTLLSQLEGYDYEFC
jgi:2',3'-cyclic-nucleotide 2'-phosphodiesterase (5'-nucleotidase family)